MNSLPRTLNFFTVVGDATGAGVAGKGFALALAERVDLRLAIVSPPNVRWQSRMSLPEEIRELEVLAEKGVSRDAPSFVRGAPMARRWHCPRDWPRRGSTLGEGNRRGAFVGHVFCEFERLLPEEIEFLRRADWITTGCDWATRVLLDHGMECVATVHQGVELDVFRPPDTPVTRPPDLEGKFLVFSGGKYEYRKGVDLTIAAFAAFAQRHSDAVLLINAFNPFPWSQGGLALSPHFRFEPLRTYPEDFARVLVQNGIPPDRFRILEPGPRTDLARTMAMSDCGLFPIRCEAGTNHFLMEYMACARPAIATYTSGLLDILRPELNSVGLTPFRQVQPALGVGETQRGQWNEPAVDEIVEALELLYWSEEKRERLGRAAAQDMHPFAWSRCAERLLQIIDAVEDFHR